MTTTAHGRHHVIGITAAGTDLIGQEAVRLVAFALAARSIGPGRYDRAEVFDSMARRGKPDTWEVFADGSAKVIGKRLPLPSILSAETDEDFERALADDGDPHDPEAWERLDEMEAIR